MVHASRAFHSAPYVEVQYWFRGQIDSISPFVQQLMRFIVHSRPADGSEMDIAGAITEALANAVIHGNRNDPKKHVYVECRCYMDGEVSIMVRDEGQGFERNKVADPTTSENRLSTHGRGIYLMEQLMDEVFFEGGGSIVHMRKKSNAQPRLEMSAG